MKLVERYMSVSLPLKKTKATSLSGKSLFAVLKE